MTKDDGERTPNTGRILIGMLIIVAGLMMLADQSGIAGGHLSGRIWPLFLIGFGVVRLAAPPRHRGRRRSRIAGAWFVFLGVWFLVNEFHLYGLDYRTSWPLLIVGAGIGMVWRALEHPACGAQQIRES